MIKKLTFTLLIATLLLSQTSFFASRQIAAQNSETLDLALMLPESDVVVTMDFNRTLNIAAPSLLGQDAVKIEHLKNLMKTVENQIGISPYEIRQIVAGVKLPPTESKDYFNDSEFTAIVRTANPNGNLIETWSKRIDVIMAFKEEQEPMNEYIGDFRQFRDFKFINATPEKIASTMQNFQNALKNTQTINSALDGLPKLTTNAKAATDLRTKNRELAATINKFITVLKADTDSKALRVQTIRLLNRWNAITLDDPQHSAKIADVLKESKQIHPLYKKKYENSKLVEDLISQIEAVPSDIELPTTEPTDEKRKEIH